MGMFFLSTNEKDVIKRLCESYETMCQIMEETKIYNEIKPSINCNIKLLGQQINTLMPLVRKVNGSRMFKLDGQYISISNALFGFISWMREFEREFDVDFNLKQ